MKLEQNYKQLESCNEARNITSNKKSSNLDYIKRKYEALNVTNVQGGTRKHLESMLNPPYKFFANIYWEASQWRFLLT